MQSCEPLRFAVLDAARTWIGTPYKHQHRLKEVAVDCVGLIVGVGLETSVLDWTAERWAPFAAYGRLPDPDKMREGLKTFLVEIEEASAGVGDIAWFAWRRGRPMHLGIVGVDETLMPGRRTLIHATNQTGKVVEHGFVAPWTGRVEGWWRYPGLAYPPAEEA